MELPTEFLYPALLFLGIPLLLFLLWLTRSSFVPDNPRFDDAAGIRRRSKLRWTVFFLRTLAIMCLLVAIATPLVRHSTIRAGDTHITILIDNSTSMNLMNTDFVDSFVSDLRQQVPVTVRTIAPGDQSAIGEGILSYMRPNENILLITDGNSNTGPSLGEVVAFASQTNTTVSALQLEARAEDAAVTVQGPPKVISGTNATFSITVTRTEDQEVDLKVLIDDEVVYDESTDDRVIQLVQSFTPGKHSISAVIETTDAIADNNRYDFLLTAVDKPKILVVSQRPTGMQSLLKSLYSVTEMQTLPRSAQELEEYYGIVLVDLPASAVAGSTDALTDYLLDGNGLLVVGGPNSYDYGGYKNTVFESLLPVTVGKGKEREGVTNIVVAMDMSSSVGGSYVEDEQGRLVFKPTDRPALVRSLTLSVLDDLDRNHNVGVVVIGSSSKNLSQNGRGESLVQWDYVGGRELGSVSLLGPKEDLLGEAVARVQGGSQAASQYWVAAPLKALETAGGSKNVIIITDGQSCTQNCQAAAGGSDEAATINLARTLAAQGGRVYTVGLTDKNEDFLISLAQAGGGIYFPATQKNKLRILFGDPSETEGNDAFGLVVLNTNHFITRDVPLQATMYGYNEVVPKAYSSLLVSAGNGNPGLTVWNYGVGRVASLTTYNGDDYGELLMRGNSLVISRAGNWVIGDPERKQEYVISIPQMHVNEEAIITITSDKIPVNDELQFVPKGKDTYQAVFTPTTAGFGNVGGMLYAANYPLEFEAVGMNPNLEAILASSSGKLFDPEDTDEIIEHAQSVRELQEVRKQPWRFPFILAAALLFLIEIAIRRIYEVMRARNA
jgi:uncharacterized membrane protein